MQNPKPIVQLRDISKNYGATAILRAVNLTVNEGEFVAVRGKSGAGKTSLFKILGLLEPPTKGNLRLFTKDMHTLGDGERAELRLRQLGLVFQFFNLLPSLTVLENVELPMALAKTPKPARRERAFELLQYFGVADSAERFPGTLSGGERQRVAVIRALVNHPQLLLADEPTSSLDDENSQLLLSMLQKINREENLTVIVTTTDLYEPLPSTSDYMLRNGVLHKVAVGSSIEELTANFGSNSESNLTLNAHRHHSNQSRDDAFGT